MRLSAIVAAAAFLLSVHVAGAQSKPASPAPAQGATAKAPAPAAPATSAAPGDYVIGLADVLTVTYRDEKEMTGDHLVRPDGKITLPLIGDIEVVGLTTEQAKDRLLQASSTLFKNPTISVGVKDINSLTVYITGGVAKPGPYKILSPMTVLQLISIAGGLREFVDGKNVVIIRNEGSKPTFFRFNYKEVSEGKNLGQNINLKPNDTVSVPE